MTLEQAILDLELLAAFDPKDGREGLDDWYDEMERQDAERQAAGPAPDLGSAVPDADAGNTDFAAAMARLKAMRAGRPVDDDAEYEIVDLVGD